MAFHSRDFSNSREGLARFTACRSGPGPYNPVEMRASGRILVTVLVLLTSIYGRAQQPYAITIERNTSLKMRDGVVLHADIYRPVGPEKFPILLERTPYNKDSLIGFAARAAAHGYIVIIQDVRGRYTSEGEWYPFKYESQDGFETVEWAGSLPYSDGKVGMAGGSYVGATQMLAAIAKPPHLAGICPVVTASNYHNGWTYQGGAFEQWFNESWTTSLAQDTVNRYMVAVSNAVEGSHASPLSRYPLFNIDTSFEPSAMTAKFAPYFLDWLAHPGFDDYWSRWSIEDHYADIQVPALTVAAWYDIFQGGSLRNYLGIRARGGSQAARQSQQLVVGVGGHAGWGREVGDLDFGPDGDFDYDSVTLAWYDFLFKGMKNEFSKPTPVKIFVMGANKLRDEEAWPLARAKNTKYFLHSSGRANSSSGDGSLSPALPSQENADEFVYDPADPAPTVGGPLCCDPVHLPAGPRDQRSVETRKDVLVFTAAPFSHDTEITGPVSVELYAKSSTVDTDFTAKIVDVWPNGFAQNLTEGIVRARYRDSQVTPSLLVPGKIYKFSIDLWSTSNIFLAGHTLRLEISSSNFPRFDRNLNTGSEDGDTTTAAKATNSIIHDAEHPSALIVPLIP